MKINVSSLVFCYKTFSTLIWLTAVVLEWPTVHHSDLSPTDGIAVFPVQVFSSLCLERMNLWNSFVN